MRLSVQNHGFKQSCMGEGVWRQDSRSVERGQSSQRNSTTGFARKTQLYLTSEIRVQQTWANTTLHCMKPLQPRNLIIHGSLSLKTPESQQTCCTGCYARCEIKDEHLRTVFEDRHTRSDRSKAIGVIYLSSVGLTRRERGVTLSLWSQGVFSKLRE